MPLPGSLRTQATRLTASLVSLTALSVLLLPAGLTAADYDFGHAGFGAWTVPVPLDVQAQQDLTPGQGMLVVWVRPGGTASSMGIHAGEVVTSINQVPVSSRHDIREVIGSVQPGDAATATVLSSDGERQTLNGTFQARPQRFWPWSGANPMAGAPDANAQRPLGGATPGPWAGMDPQAAITEQRQELLAAQDAISATAQALAQLRDELVGSGQTSGAWCVHYQLLPSTPSEAPIVACSPAPAPPADAPPGYRGDAWSCSLAITSPEPGP